MKLERIVGKSRSLKVWDILNVTFIKLETFILLENNERNRKVSSEIQNFSQSWKVSLKLGNQSSFDLSNLKSSLPTFTVLSNLIQHFRTSIVTFQLRPELSNFSFFLATVFNKNCCICNESLATLAELFDDLKCRFQIYLNYLKLTLNDLILVCKW